MKKILMIATMFAAIAVSAIAADTNSLFNANELSISLGSAYTVDRAAAFKQPYSINLEAGANYFITKNIGLEASVPFYQEHGVSVSEVEAGALLRLPVFRHLAFYAGAGGIYGWNNVAQKWAYQAKAGAEWRFNSKWGIFGEGRYRNTDFDWNKGQTSVAGGLRLVF